ncbi:hypothetical protein Ancab_039225 [Ancistrocladus abbreviatus]
MVADACHAFLLCRKRFPAFHYFLIYCHLQLLLPTAAFLFSELARCSCNTPPVSSPSSRGICWSVDSVKYDSSNGGECLKNIGSVGGALSSEDVFKILDADFFTTDKMTEIVKDGGLTHPSVLVFHPQLDPERVESAEKSFTYPSISIQRPENEEDLAFMNVLELGQLIKAKKISSVELTGVFLRRLKRYNHVLQAVVTVTEELAYQQAKEADKLLSQGVYLGPLHGIPYGLKDIISVPHYPTTWGSRSFKDQVVGVEAWVYKRLKSAGGVLVGKLVTGSLAYDDIWFGGRTRNPWNIEEYSTGSSAGPAACTSAGMVPFAIGSETAGSITYPAARCGVTALRPTFGTVGRTGVMSISESLEGNEIQNATALQDKLGPFCRSAADCAVILDVIRGKDPDDLSSRDMPFDDPFSVDLTKINVGYLDDAEMEVSAIVLL